MVTWTTLGNGDKRAFLTSADASPFDVPADWNNAANLIECIGGGMNGSAVSSDFGSSLGGHGACYARKANVSLTPGGTCDFAIAAAGGDTWAVTNTTVLARRGQTSTAGCIGDVVYRGGLRDSVGGGGGAAGPNGPGGGAPDDEQFGGDGGPTGGGAGGDNTGTGIGADGQEWDSIHGSGGGAAPRMGATVGQSGFAGGKYGGGGGGHNFASGTGIHPGGPGAPGLIVITYTPGPVQQFTSVSLSGSSSAYFAGKIDAHTSCGFSATGSLAARAVKGRMSAIAFGAVSDLAAYAVKWFGARAAFIGVGSLDAQARAAAIANVALSAGGNVVMTGRRATDGRATFTGAGVIVAAVIRGHFAATAFSAPGGMTATAIKGRYSATDLSGAGTLAARAVINIIGATTPISRMAVLTDSRLTHRIAIPPPSLADGRITTISASRAAGRIAKL